MKMHEFIDNNYDLFKSMVKCGMISTKLLHYYNIFKTYQGCNDLSTKTKRWIFTAIVMKTSESTVITALKIMDSKVPFKKQMIN